MKTAKTANKANKAKRVNPYPLFVVAAVLVSIVFPISFLGPILPLTDFMAFVGIHSYPPELSYGPKNYYVFQLTYILVHALVRVFGTLGIPRDWQISLFYVLQAGLSVYIINGLLSVFIKNKGLLGICVACGFLAFISGMFMWGGPLPYSIGYLLIGWAVFLVIREIDDEEGARRPAHSLSVIFLSLFAVSSHPFMLIFALMNLASRFVFLPRLRKSTIIGIALLLLYGLLIDRDNPEKVAGSRITELFAVWPQLIERLKTIFLSDWAITSNLLPDTSKYSLVHLYFIFKSVIIFIGIVFSPVMFFREKNSAALKLLFFQSAMSAVVFLWTNNNKVITYWPERFLSAQYFLFFCTGIICVGFLIEYFSNKILFLKNSIEFSIKFKLLNPMVFVILILIILCQLQLFSGYNKLYAENYLKVKNYIIDNAKNSVSIIEIGAVYNNYLIGIPFFLYSDSDVISNNIYVFTHWHREHRHNIRFGGLTENIKVLRFVLVSVDSRNIVLQPIN